jgi:hypothetical protein
MRHPLLPRILPVLFLAGMTATLAGHSAAQSTVSFETYGDTYQTNSGPVVAGDFNNDGKPDLVEGGNDQKLIFRAGNGDGTFKPPVVAASTPVAVDTMFAVDLNGDGKLDLVAMAAQNPPSPPGSGYYYLTVYFGNGDGTFQAPKTYATSATPQGPLAVGNFFGNGLVDAAAATANGIDVFRNEGNGTYTLAESIVVGNAGYLAVELVAGDFNGTGVSDLAADVEDSYDGGTPHEISVLWNDGKGNFSQQVQGSYYDPMVAVSRLNGDAMMDLLVLYTCAPDGTQNYDCSGFDGYYGQGNNTLYKRTLVTTNEFSAANAYGLAGVDVNGDGYGDIVAFGVTSTDCPNACPNFPSGLHVWLGNADGSFQQTPQEVITSNDAQLGPIAWADFNRDGMMDFVEATPGSGGTSQYYINATTRTDCGKYTISPTVTVCQPVDNTYAVSPVRVHANSYDTTPVTAMQEYIDNSLKYSEAVTSFDTTFDLDTGTHFLVTKAWDSSGRDFVADRTVTVYKGTAGPVCPAAPDSASICLPSGDTSSSPVFILANGDTGDLIPTAAQLYIDGNLVVNNKAQCNGTTDDCYGGYSYVQTTQTLSPGSHNLVFKVWDTAGNVYEAQKTVTVN